VQQRPTWCGVNVGVLQRVVLHLSNVFLTGFYTLNILMAKAVETHKKLHGAEFLWEAKSHSAGQEIISFLWNRIHRSLNPVHTRLSYFFRIQFNIILPFMPRSSKCYLPFTFLSRILYAFFNYTTCVRVMILDLIVLIGLIFLEEYKLWRSSLWSLSILFIDIKFIKASSRDPKFFNAYIYTYIYIYDDGHTTDPSPCCHIL
jgi:hypothetical protein